MAAQWDELEAIVARANRRPFRTVQRQLNPVSHSCWNGCRCCANARRLSRLDPRDARISSTGCQRAPLLL